MTARASKQAESIRKHPFKVEELEREEYEYFKRSGKAKQWQSETGSIPPQNISNSVTDVYNLYKNQSILFGMMTKQNIFKIFQQQKILKKLVQC